MGRLIILSLGFHLVCIGLLLTLEKQAGSSIHPFLGRVTPIDLFNGEKVFNSIPNAPPVEQPQRFEPQESDLALPQSDLALSPKTQDLPHKTDQAITLEDEKKLQTTLESLLTRAAETYPTNEEIQILSSIDQLDNPEFTVFLQKSDSNLIVPSISESLYVRVLVDTSGYIESIYIQNTKGQEVQDSAWLRWIGQWRFPPPHQMGFPVKVWYEKWVADGPK